MNLYLSACLGLASLSLDREERHKQKWVLSLLVPQDSRGGRRRRDYKSGRRRHVLVIVHKHPEIHFLGQTGFDHSSCLATKAWERVRQIEFRE